jgi:ABC-type spermidine/putrescine transport system permease subunit II
VNPRPWWTKLGFSILILLVTVYCVFPIYFVLVQSLKTAQEDIFGNPLIVLHPSFESFEELFEAREGSRGFVGSALHRSYPFLDWLVNTLVVFAGTLALTLSASIAAAYALGRLQPPGFRWWRRAIFATYVIPQTILFVPLYRVVLGLGLDDNLLALLLIYPTMALPFCIWILSVYFQHLPREIEEAALIEGPAALGPSSDRPAHEPSRPRGSWNLYPRVGRERLHVRLPLSAQRPQPDHPGRARHHGGRSRRAGGGGGNQSDGAPVILISALFARATCAASPPPWWRESERPAGGQPRAGVMRMMR